MLDSNTKTLFLLHSIWIKKNTQSPSDGHLMWRTDSFEKTLMLGNTKAWGEGNDRGWESWMASATQWTWVWVNSGSWLWTGRPGVLWSMGSQEVGHDWATEMNWTELNPISRLFLLPGNLFLETCTLSLFAVCFSQRLWQKVRCPAACPVKTIKR